MSGPACTHLDFFYRDVRNTDSTIQTVVTEPNLTAYIPAYNFKYPQILRFSSIGLLLWMLNCISWWR